MRKKIIRIAIYARKSVFRDNSDSTKSQLEMCSERCKMLFPGCVITYYEDEGFSGANTNRPDFKRMMYDLRLGKIDMVYCYKLDRVSRSLKDFVNFYSELQDYDAEFGCLRDQIDTTTAIGRAMMYIISIFAEIERENTRERVIDGMLQLAKLGCWTGGPKTPPGYDAAPIVINGKKHKMLVPDEDNSKLLNTIQTLSLSGKSSYNIQTILKKQGIKTSATTIQRALSSPYNCTADEYSLLYFKSKGCKIVNSLENNEQMWDGTHGIMVYNRRKGANKMNPSSEWIVCVGRHKPLTDSRKWIKIQDCFVPSNFVKQRKYDTGLLRGIIKCGRCGYAMGIDNKKRNAEKIDSYYKCNNRNRFGLEVCDCKAVKTEVLDRAVIDVFKSISLDKKLIDKYKYVAEADNNNRSTKVIKKDISKLEKKIENLTSAIASGSGAAKYLINEIERLDAQILNLRSELREAELNKLDLMNIQEDKDALYTQVKLFVDNLDNLEYEEANGILRKIIKECSWDNEQLDIKL